MPNKIGTAPMHDNSVSGKMTANSQLIARPAITKINISLPLNAEIIPRKYDYRRNHDNNYRYDAADCDRVAQFFSQFLHPETKLFVGKEIA